MAGVMEEIPASRVPVAPGFVRSSHVWRILGASLQPASQEERLLHHPRMGAVFLARGIEAHLDRLR